MFEAVNNFSESFDRGLERRVGEHLAKSHATALRRLRIAARRGTLTLRGSIDSIAIRRAILAIVRGVPGVQRVIDDTEDAFSPAGDSGPAVRYDFSPALARYFEERRQGLVSASALTWDS